MTRLFIALSLLFVAVQAAYAGPNDFGKARRALESIKKGERDLSSALKKLTSSERARLKRTTRGLDSDKDGLPDVLEPSLGAGRCDADSDDDGLDDGDDSDEDNSDGGGGGIDDGETVETKGVITSFNDPQLVIGTTRLEISPGTIFFRGLSSKADLVQGVCVEAESSRVGTTLVVDKIKKHRGSACGGGDD